MVDVYKQLEAIEAALIAEGVVLPFGVDFDDDSEQ